MEKENRVVNVLSVAGVDPSGGAGVFADVKTMSALGAYGMGIVVALTAQSTKGVTGVQKIPADFIRSQFETLFDDVRVDAVKIGMLLDAETVRTVADCLRRHPVPWIVLDPVMIAKSGDPLLLPEAVQALKDELLPMASVVTPNLPECGVLLGREVRGEEDMPQAALELFERTEGRCSVYLKGGHLEGGRCTDCFYDGKELTVIEAPRFATKNTHGTGCTLSSAIAALLAQTGEPLAAVRAAKAYISEAIASSGRLSVGTGHGPVDHFVRQFGA